MVVEVELEAVDALVHVRDVEAVVPIEVEYVVLIDVDVVLVVDEDVVDEAPLDVVDELVAFGLERR